MKSPIALRPDPTGTKIPHFFPVRAGARIPRFPLMWGWGQANQSPFPKRGRERPQGSQHDRNYIYIYNFSPTLKKSKSINNDTNNFNFRLFCIFIWIPNFIFCSILKTIWSLYKYISFYMLVWQVCWALYILSSFHVFHVCIYVY